MCTQCAPASRPLKAMHAQIADARAHLLRNDLRQRLHHGVRELIARTESRDHRRGKRRIGEAALRRDDLDRTGQAAVLRYRAVDRAVEQDRAQGQPDRAIDGAFERHVDRLVRQLRRRAGEIDDDVVAAHLQGHADRQVAPRRIGVVEEAVDDGSWPNSRRRAAREWPRASAVRNSPSDPRRRRSRLCRPYFSTSAR